MANMHVHYSSLRSFALGFKVRVEFDHRVTPGRLIGRTEAHWLADPVNYNAGFIFCKRVL